MPGTLAQNLSFVLLGEDRTASKTMTGVEATAIRVTGRVGSAFTKLGGTLGGEFGSVITGIGTGITELDGKAAHLASTLEIGGGILAGAGLGLLQFGSAEQQASDQLKQAITSAGEATTDYAEDIDKLVSREENLDHGATDTKTALAKLVEQTGSTKKALSEMAIVSELAAAKHISLSDAAGLVTRVLSGSGARVLTQYGIHMDGVGEKTEQGQRALDELAKKLDGQDKAAVTNFGSQVDIIRTKISDWAEEVSGPLGTAMTIIGPVITGVGVIVDVVRAKQQAATLATIAQAAAATDATAATEAETAAQVGLDGAMDANPIGLVALAIGGLAAIAGGVALGSMHDLTKATQDYSSALATSNGLIDENVEKTAAKALLDSGALKAAKDLGINTSLVVQAALGEKGARAELTAQIKSQTDAMNAQVTAASTTAEGGRLVQYSQREARAEINLLTGAVGDQSQALKDAKQNYNLLTGAVNQLTGAQQHAIDVGGARYAGYAAAHSTGRATGGIVQPGEITTINERGPETLRLPSGTMVYPTGTGPSAGGGATFQFVFNGDVYGSPNAHAKAMVTEFTNAVRQGHIPANALSTALTNA